MAPDQVYGTFQAVSEHPEARNKRAAFRDALESQQAKMYLNMPDPREWYGRSGVRRFWEELELNVATLEGKQGAEKQAMLRDRLRLYRASGPNGPSFREDLEMSGPGGPKQFARTIWSADAGFHPIQFTIWQDGFEKRALVSKEWRFRRVGGIYVPAWVRELTYSGDKLDREREFELQECTLNESVEPSQFSYAGLGLKDGELVMDRVDGICYIMRNGQPEKLANFYEKYLPPTVSRRHRWSRWLSVGMGILLLAAAVIWVYRGRVFHGRPGTSQGKEH